MIILSLIIVLILILVLFLYNKDLFHRNVVITIVTNLPLGIFKDENNIKKEKEKEVKRVPVVKLETNEEVLEKVKSDEDIEFPKEKDITVYWTPNGKSYHTKNNCMTLSRSKKILTGTLSECEKEICCEHCKAKED